MTNDELTAAFPHGAMLIPENEAPSSRVRVGQFWEDDPEVEAKYFNVWLDQYRDLQMVRSSIEPFKDGFNVKSSAGQKYFLRPLPEGEVPF